MYVEKPGISSSPSSVGCVGFETSNVNSGIVYDGVDPDATNAAPPSSGRRRPNPRQTGELDRSDSGTRRVARLAEAVRERNRYLARAADAGAQLAADPELSILQSLKAHERTPTVEAQNALRRSLLRSRGRAAFRRTIDTAWHSTAGWQSRPE